MYQQYLKETISRVEAMFGVLKKSTLPIMAGDHLELDDNDSTLFGWTHSDHRRYQMRTGILNWVVNISKIDVTFATFSLSRFSACPRTRALKVFGYKIKKGSNRRICVDSTSHQVLQD